ncbi:signal peptidase I [Leifsonia xyli]|uniref:signal peptidase I n=1 Tax=Leifsonia xyli TaxID=1575 RepID=UPI0005C46CC0|nr:signal peptidase I [Leifsonia xyli]
MTAARHHTSARGVRRMVVVSGDRRVFRGVVVVWVVTANVCRAIVWCLVGLLVWGIAPFAIGWHATTVMSGSITPAIRAGDLVVIRPVSAGQLRAGQVVQFDDPDNPGRLRLHRLVKIQGDTLTTKGDANAHSDSSPVTAGMVHGVGVLRVPGVGIPVKAFAEHNYLLLAVLVLAVLALLVGTRLDHAYDWLPTDDGPEEEPTRETPTPATNHNHDHDHDHDGLEDLLELVDLAASRNTTHDASP